MTAAATPARRSLRILAGLAGAGLVLAYAPFGYHWVAPLALALLTLLWGPATPRDAAVLGFCFGLGLFGAGTYWLYISLNILGGLWPPFAVLLMLALVVALATYLALGGYLLVRLVPQDGWPRWLIAWPALWVIIEWLRGWLFTGFPWLSVGYAQVDTPLAALAPVLGVHGVSWVTLLIAGLTTAIVRCEWRGRLAAIATVAALMLALQPLNGVEWTERGAQELRVALVQGAIPQAQKWRPEQLQPTLELYRRLSFAEQDADLIVWPEAAIPAFPFEVTEFVDELHAELLARDAQLLTGILSFDADTGRYLNTLWALGAEGGRYHKRHLVMFGEYFPLPDFAKRWLRIMNLPSESIAAGSAEQPLLRAQGVPLAATICYELAFAAEQLAFFPTAELLVNVSNDGWFGDSIAPHQHLQIGQMRARETGRYLLRATNTGITAVVDPRGGVVARMPQFEPGVVRAVVHPQRGMTPFLRYGHVPLLLTALLLLVGSGLAAARMPRAARSA